MMNKVKKYIVDNHIVLILLVAVLSLIAYLHNDSLQRLYDIADGYMMREEYDKAQNAFSNLGNYKDSKEKAIYCRYEPKYEEALQYMTEERWRKAALILWDIPRDFKDANIRLYECLLNLPY